MGADQHDALTSPEQPFLTRLFLGHTWSLVALLVVVGAVMLLQIFQVSRGLEREAAVHHAESYTAVIRELRSLYTSEVVARVKGRADSVRDYTDHAGTIPLPITLSLMIGERLGRTTEGLEVHIYSGYPFPTDPPRPPLEGFRLEAWNALQANPQGAVVASEVLNGHRVIRYATADLMRPSCVSCHNTHPESPKTDWGVGDVRGVVEVVYPLDLGATSIYLEVLVAVSMGFITLMGFALLFYRLRYESLRRQEASERLRIQSEAVSSLLDNMQQAVFAIDETSRIVPPVSRHTALVLGDRIEGQPLGEVLYRYLSPDDRARAQSALDVVFGEGELQWDLMQENFPRRLMVEGVGRDRVLRVLHTPVWSPDGELERILLVVEDITEVDRLERAVNAQRETATRDIRMLEELAVCDPGELDGFFAAAVEQLHRADTEQLGSMHRTTTAPGRPRWTLDSVHDMFRSLHTLKGNARLLELSWIVSTAHAAEDAASQVREALTHGQAVEPALNQEVRDRLDELRDALSRYNRLAERVFRVEDRFHLAALSEVHELTAELDHIIARVLGGNLALGIDRLERAIEILGHLHRHAEDLLDSVLAERVATFQVLLSEVGRSVRTLNISWRTFGPPLEDVCAAVHQMLWKSSVSSPLSTSKAAWLPLATGLIGLHFASSTQEEAARLRRHCAAYGLGYLERLLGRVEHGTEVEAAQAISAGMRFLYLYLWLELRVGDDAPRRDKLRKMVMARGNDDVSVPSAAAGTFAELLRAIEGAGHDPWALLEAMAAALDVDEADIRDQLLCADEEEFGARAALDAVVGNVPYDKIPDRLRDAAAAGSVTSACVLGLISIERGVTRGTRYLFRHDLVRMLRAFQPDVDGARAVPAATAVSRYGPMVSELALALGKSARLDINGGDVMVPTHLLPHIRTALVHLLRNAVDHGIGTAAQRDGVGKPAEGVLVISFDSGEDGTLRIELEDDGGGIDVEAVVDAAVERGVIDRAELDGLSDEQRLNLIFRPGVSSADTVTELSGRGVGLDAVAESLKDVNATVRVFSESGQGARFVLEFPALD